MLTEINVKNPPRGNSVFSADDMESSQNKECAGGQRDKKFSEGPAAAGIMYSPASRM